MTTDFGALNLPQNEPEHKMKHWPCAKGCHKGHFCAPCAVTYTRIFDAVAAVLRADHPQLQLHGLARGTVMDRNLTWTKEFFSATNHAAGATPPEYASYHFCECFCASLSDSGWLLLSVQPVRLLSIMHQVPDKTRALLQTPSCHRAGHWTCGVSM
jgi:hypothetical protein